MGLRPFCAVASLSAAFLGAATPALAEPSPWTPRTQGSRAGVDFGVWSTKLIDTLTFAIIAQLEVARVVHIDVEVPWTGLVFRGLEITDARFLFGNLTAGVHYGAKLNETIALHAGGTISIPTLERLYPVTLMIGTSGASAYAYSDMHRYYPEYLHVRARGGAEVRITPIARYRGEIAPLLMIPWGNNVDSTEFVFETSHELEARARLGLGGGARLQAVFLTFLKGDSSQIAVEPFLAYEPPTGHFYARVGLLLALDEPLGFGFRQGRVSTVRTSFGGKW